MFKRRSKLTLLSKTKNIFAPIIHPVKWYHHYRFRLLRLSTSPQKIAFGFSVGVFVSFTPFIGFHLILSFVISWIFRSSVLASFIGTIIGNPLTFPFIWFSTYKLGTKLLGIPATHHRLFLNKMHIFQIFSTHFETFFHRIIWPMFVGSLPLGFLAGCLSYVLIRTTIALYRKERDILEKRKIFKATNTKKRKNIR